MKLIDLHPRWMDGGGEPRQHGIGVVLDCPCGACGNQLFVPFTNPLEGSQADPSRSGWQRTGETFETLTLTPSILRNKDKGGCGWHGFITNGEVVGA